MLHLEKFKRIYFKEHGFWNVAEGGVVFWIVNRKGGGRCIPLFSYRSVQTYVQKNKHRMTLLRLSPNTNLPCRCLYTL